MHAETSVQTACGDVVEDPEADNQKEQRSRPDSLRILSYNLGAGGLGAERLNNSNGHRLAVLMEDLEFLMENFDVIGLSETHCTEETHRTWTDGTLFGAEIHIGARDRTANKGGVGFIIHPRLAASKRVHDVRIVSSRIAVLKLEVPGQRRPLKIVQVYAPHSGYDDDIIEQLYDEKEDEKYIGPHSIEQRNESGEKLAAFAESHRLYVANTFFEKPPNKRWTWRSPSFDLFCELDYVLCDDRSCVTNVEVLSRFGCSSDHRPVRATIRLDGKLMQKKLLLSSLTRAKKTNYSALKAEANATDWKVHGRINEQYEQLTEKLKRCMKAATLKEEEQFRSRLSEDTRKKLALLKTLKATQANAERYRALATEVRRQVMDDHTTYREERMTRAAEERSSLKKCSREIAQTRLITAALKDSNGSRKTNRREIEGICRTFYTQLFDSKVHVERNLAETDDNAETLPSVTWEEVKKAVRSMKLGKRPDPMASPRNTCEQEANRSGAWKESKTVLLYKKGDPENISNYRPICLLSVVYKVFPKLILKRLTDTLDAAQPPEQAGSRSGYCTMDHLQTIIQLQEKAREFGQRLFIVFIDYEKAFDSIEMNAVWNALEEQGVDHRYVGLLEETNTGCTTDITLFQDPIRMSARAIPSHRSSSRRH
ncbi:reverse transcriptase [Aphelenchoides avenae]|nr:reverse transcriptase [Aphelenchus avenae]